MNDKNISKNFPKSYQGRLEGIRRTDKFSFYFFRPYLSLWLLCLPKRSAEICECVKPRASRNIIKLPSNAHHRRKKKLLWFICLCFCFDKFTQIMNILGMAVYFSGSRRSRNQRAESTILPKATSITAFTWGTTTPSLLASGRRVRWGFILPALTVSCYK